MRNGSNNCFSHIDSNAFMELNGGTSQSLCPKAVEAPNLCRKSRARNGHATDSQSMYARVSLSSNIDQIYQLFNEFENEIFAYNSDGREPSLLTCLFPLVFV